jgi:protein gp37
MLMSENSAIEWTDATWGPLLGCSKVSEGCRNCYAINEAWKKQHHPHPAVRAAYAGLVEKRSDGSLNWTGKVNFIPERLEIPLRWKTPRRIFVNSMSDLFHGTVSDEAIDHIWAIMAATPRHTYQILTKRPERMAEYLSDPIRIQCSVLDRITPADRSGSLEWRWPLPNVWLGTSVEHQAAADERIPHLLATPAAVRFLSCEPLLGPIEFSDVTKRADAVQQLGKKAMDGIHWVITGGESGSQHRPIDPDWARSLRDQCQAAGVPFFFKQWSGFRPKAAGRLLDGREWNELPTVAVGAAAV